MCSAGHHESLALVLSMCRRQLLHRCRIHENVQKRFACFPEDTLHPVVKETFAMLQLHLHIVDAFLLAQLRLAFVGIMEK